MRLVLILLLILPNATAVLATGVVSVPFVPAGLKRGDTYQIAFVTDGAKDAISFDIGDYNNFVQGEAERSGALTEDWGVDWFAIGSTDTVNARDNALVKSPVYLLTGELFAEGFGGIWDGLIDTALEVTQYGKGKSGYAFTGSGSDGFGSGAKVLGARTSFDESAMAVIRNIRIAWSDPAEEAPRNEALSFFALSEQLTVVPEPAAFGMCVVSSGLLAIGGFARRKRTIPTVP